MITHTQSFLEKDLRIIYYLLDVANNGDYNTKLYIKSKYVFRLAPEHTHQAITNINKHIHQCLYILRQQKPTPNLTPLSLNIMQYLKYNDLHMVIHVSNNFGPCILETHSYIYRGFA